MISKVLSKYDIYLNIFCIVVPVKINRRSRIINILVIKASAVSMLGGILDMRNGPLTSVGITLMKSMPFFSANSKAVFSATVLA